MKPRTHSGGERTHEERRDAAPHEPLLDVVDLRTYFSLPAGTVRAVNGVSLRCERGKTLGIVGESGSGKTVLARSIMRLLVGNNVTTTGAVRFDGIELLDLPMRAMRDVWGREMAMVFQDPLTSLNPVVRVGRQITEHLRRHLGVSRSQARDVGIELLRSMRIPEPARRFGVYPHQLSGGMRQRITTAMALACGPKLLIADEPTTALDVTVQHQILNLLGTQQRDRFMAMVLVTHDLGVVAGRTDDLMVMYAGKVVERGPTPVVFANPKMPYTEALLRATPRTTQPKHTRLAAITGRPPDLISVPAGCSFAARCSYAQARCHQEAPPLTAATETGHEFACWYPIANREAPELAASRRPPQAPIDLGGDVADHDAVTEQDVPKRARPTDGARALPAKGRP